MNKRKIKNFLALLITGAISFSVIGLGSTTLSFATDGNKTNGVELFPGKPDMNYQTKGGKDYWNALEFIDGVHDKYYDKNGLNIIWKNMYDHRYLAYTLTPPGEQEADRLNKYQPGSAQWNRLYNFFHNPANLMEHQNETLCTDKEGLKYMSHNNLKWKSVEENDHSGNNLLDGTYLITIPPYPDSPTNKNNRNYIVGKMMEWRYLGYSPSGDKIPNPRFPNDGFVDKPWPSIGWDKNFKTDFNLVEMSGFDTDEDKDKWSKDYLLPAIEKEEARLGKKLTTDRDPASWAKKFSVKADPNYFTGIWQGTTNGGRSYMSVVTPCPPQPNLRLIDYKVYDKTTGQLLGRYTRDGVKIDEPNDRVEPRLSMKGNGPANIEKFDTFLMKAEVMPEETYRIVANVKNMTPPNHETVNDEISLDWGVATSNEALNYNAYLSKLPYHGKITPGMLDDGTPKVVIHDGKTDIVVDGPSTIPAGATVTFTEDVEMPMTANQYFKPGVSVPEKYYNLQDDTDLRDNLAYLGFKMHDRNMKMDSVSFIDEHGITVPDKKLVPGQKYKVKFLVSYDGKAMPKSADVNIVDIQITNTKGGITYIGGAWETEPKNVKLNDKDTLTFETTDYFIPTEPRVYARGTVTTEKRFNFDEGLEKNDNTKDAEITAPDEIFDLKPMVQVKSENDKCLVNQVGGSQKTDIVVDIDVNSISPFDNYIVSTKAVVEISGPSIQGSAPHSQLIDLKDLHNGINKGVASVRFNNVEVKPIGGEIKIHSKVILNPGMKTFETEGGDREINNTTEKDTMLPIICTPPHEVCPVEWLRNDWGQTFYITTWSGSSCDKHGCHKSYSYSNPTESAYEVLTLKKFDFRSKTSDDLQGGVVDLRSPGAKGKIKAGYGFELEVEFNYETNRLRIQPKEWDNGCSSGQRFSPHVSPVNLPTEVYVKLGTTPIPFGQEISDSAFESAEGKYISNVQKEGYEQLLNCTSEGEWYNKTVKCKLSEGNTFGIKSTNKLYIDENSKNGRYPIMLTTNKDFYGVYDYDKNAPNNLCIKKVRYVDVIGSYQDDLKSHITQ